LDLIGLDYLWKVVLNGSDEVSSRAIELLKETYTKLGPKLQANQVDIHEDVIASCFDRLRAASDTISIIINDAAAESKLRQEVQRMTRVLKVMHEYISQCDNDFGEERTVLPMARAFRGVQLMLTIKFPNQGRQMEDVEIWTHANDSLYNIRRQILAQVKATNASSMKVDLYLNGEIIDPNTVKLISQLKLKDKAILTGKLYQVNSNMPSSPDSSSDSSTGSPHHPYEGPNQEAECCLPGVILSKKSSHAQFLFQISDLGMKVQHLPLVHNALSILRLMPADQETITRIREACSSASDSQDASDFDSLFLMHESPTQVAYNLIVIYSLLMPAQNPLSSESQEFQFNFIRSGCGFKVIDLLSQNNFLAGADNLTKM
jgi:ubiquitin carboxyl-terminal hydrolase 9/24